MIYIQIIRNHITKSYKAILVYILYNSNHMKKVEA